ncbi:hypothetical protein BaRGS_00009916 [Batillaria attramentaria]|uniref:Uncharacterized protein n=1 Tax=Batillaria attramentaria TaxID=370345 RepID=A0ABD0LGV7_9CAEN
MDRVTMETASSGVPPCFLPNARRLESYQRLQLALTATMKEKKNGTGRNTSGPFSQRRTNCPGGGVTWRNCCRYTEGWRVATRSTRDRSNLFFSLTQLSRNLPTDVFRLVIYLDFPKGTSLAVLWCTKGCRQLKQDFNLQTKTLFCGHQLCFDLVDKDFVRLPTHFTEISARTPTPRATINTSSCLKPFRVGKLCNEHNIRPAVWVALGRGGVAFGWQWERKKFDQVPCSGKRQI